MIRQSYEEHYGAKRLVISAGYVRIFVLGGHVSIPSSLRVLNAPDAANLAACLKAAAEHLERSA